MLQRWKQGILPVVLYNEYMLLTTVTVIYTVFFIPWLSIPYERFIMNIIHSCLYVLRQ